MIIPDSAVWQTLAAAAGGAAVTVVGGLIAWGALKRDVEWLKEASKTYQADLHELRELFFKFVQEHRGNL